MYVYIYIYIYIRPAALLPDLGPRRAPESLSWVGIETQ